MYSRNIRFTNRSGHVLHGAVDQPDAGDARAWALFAHCFTCSGHMKAARAIANALTGRGFGVLRFDFTGLGRSDGDFSESTLGTNVHDLEDAAAFLAGDYAAPSVVIGHSLGGVAALLAASRLPSVRAAATIGTPADPAHVTHLFSDHIESIETQGSAKVCVGGRPFAITREFLRDLREHTLDSVLPKLAKPVLFLHAPRDAIVGIENAAQLFHHAKHPKSFVSLDDADHLLSRPADAIYAAEVIASWAARYLPDGDKPAAREKPAESGHVLAAIGKRPYSVRLTANGHTWWADEPEGDGGTDSGPTPVDHLLGALGGCTAITLRMYADHKKLSLDGADIRLSRAAADNKVPAAKTAERAIIRRIRLSGDLTQAERRRLLEIAEKCPVHRILAASATDIRTELEEA